MDTFYDNAGNAVAYIDDGGEYIYLYSGEPVAWVSDESIYSYSGRYLGWLASGWLYDRSGRPAFFTDHATAGPAKPAKGAKPARGARGARPARGAREAKPAKPARSVTWSSLSNRGYFEQ